MRGHNKITPTAEEHDEAKLHPDGWVYRISGNFDVNDNVPPEAIVGAWKIDKHGYIEGGFIPNPNFAYT